MERVARETHIDFVAAVAGGRKLPVEKVAPFADGRVIIGREALDLGLVDKLGDIYDAGREVYAILGKPLADGQDAKFYYPQDKFKEFKDLLKGVSSIVKAVPLSPQLKFQWQ